MGHKYTSPENAVATTTGSISPPAPPMVVTLNSPELVGSGSAARSPERGVPLQLHTRRTPSSPTLSALAGSVGCVHTPNTVPVWPRSGWLHRGMLASNRFDAAARAAYHALHMPVLGGARERAAAKRGSPRVSVSHGESSLASAAKRLLHSPLRDSSAGVDSRFRTSTIHSSGSCESDGTGCCCASAGEAIAVTVVDTATRERGQDDTLKILCGKLRNISQTVLTFLERKHYATACIASSLLLRQAPVRRTPSIVCLCDICHRPIFLHAAGAVWRKTRPSMFAA